MAKYPYIVNKDGVWYPSGTEVPDDAVHEHEEVERESNFNYTKTDINRMPISELRELAEKQEISGFEEKTGADLKKLLIEKFGL